MNETIISRHSMDVVITASLSPVKFAAAWAVVTAGATLQGSIGFGLGLIGAPMLALIEPRLVPGPLLVAALTLTLLVLHRERRSIDVSGLKWALGGRLLGSLLAVAALTVLPQNVLTVTFGGLVILAVITSASGWRFQPTVGTFIGAGTLSGLMGTIASIGGPPMAIIYQGALGARARGTLSSFFVVGVSISLTALGAAGRFGRDELWLALSLLPGILLGFAVSARTAPLLDRGYTRAGVLIASAAAGLAVILRQLI